MMMASIEGVSFYAGKFPETEEISTPSMSKVEELRDELTAFLNDLPKDTCDFDEAQRKAAEILKNKILAFCNQERQEKLAAVMQDYEKNCLTHRFVQKDEESALVDKDEESALVDIEKINQLKKQGFEFPLSQANEHVNTISNIFKEIIGINWDNELKEKIKKVNPQGLNAQHIRLLKKFEDMGNMIENLKHIFPLLSLDAFNKMLANPSEPPIKLALEGALVFLKVLDEQPS